MSVHISLSTRLNCIYNYLFVKRASNVSTGNPNPGEARRESSRAQHEPQLEEAASIPLVGLTAWQALVERADLKKGQKVFIQAGSGGVGTIAIQLAKHVGAIVATTTSAENLDWIKGLGADIVIDYKKDDFERILHDYDVVLNSQDAKTLENSLRVLKPGGKLISISGPPDPDFAKEIGLSWVLKLAMQVLSFRIRKQAKRRNVSYSFLFMRATGVNYARSPL